MKHSRSSQVADSAVAAVVPGKGLEVAEVGVVADEPEDAEAVMR